MHVALRPQAKPWKVSLLTISTLTFEISVQASVDCSADLNKGNHFQQIVHMERLREDRTVNGANEFVHLRAAAMAGHEYEAVAKVWAHSLDGSEEHVARKRRHHHVAKDDFEVLGEDFMHALDAILDAHDIEAVAVEEFIHDFLELRIILEQEYSALEFWSRRLGEDIRNIQSGGLVCVTLHALRELRPL